MTDRDGFRVAVKPSTIDANEATRALTAERGNPLTFESRTAAEAEAARLSERGATPVAIQRAAPQDPEHVDAYLVPRPERRTRDPIESADGRLTFETTAAQYGALGETLVCCYSANPPLLTAYVRDDLGDEFSGDVEDSLWIDVDRDPDPVVYGATSGDSATGRNNASGRDTATDRATRLSWVPDCVARARDGPGGPVLSAYYCEIKTGDASFQRDQATVMAYEAREANVLKVRVDVDGLPDEYTARIDRVDPEEPPRGISNLSSPDARLDDFA